MYDEKRTLLFKSSFCRKHCFSTSDSNVIASFIFFFFKSYLFSAPTSPCSPNTTSNIASFMFPLMFIPIKKFLQLASNYLAHLRSEHLLKHFKHTAIKAGSPSVILFSKLHFLAMNCIADS